ncbi:MAG: YfcC family protein [Gemmatimonadales bacterium]
MRRLAFPHPLTLLTCCVLLAAALSHVLPAGRYDRRDDPATGRSVVVAGTYHTVPPAPVGVFQTIVAIPKGLIDAASVIFFVFLVGGAFTVVDQTGALRQAVGWLVRRLGTHDRIVIPVVSLLFAAGGALENMQEEIIALVPVLLLLCGRMGFTPLTAVAMSLGSAAVGAAFSPIDPFQVGIAQKLAGLPLLSGASFRMVFLAMALSVWILGTMRHASRTRGPANVEAGPAGHEAFDARRMAVLGLVVATFVAFVIGVMRFEWDFDQMAALFLAMGIVAGILGGLGIGGTADSFVEGFKSMALAAMLIGFARAVFVVLDHGQIIDTIVHAAVTPLSTMPVSLAALGMMVFHTVVHVPVPSVSGQAVLTMPVLVPVSDLLSLSRQVTVLAYQFGAGLCELLTPTNGALMAILVAARVRYDEWLKFAVPLYLALFALGAVAVIAAIAVGLR